MFIRKRNAEESIHETDISYRFLYPWQEVVNTPFNSMWCTVEVGKESTPHNHHDVETFFITQGRGVMTVNDESIEVEAGDVVYLPPLSTHSLKNTSQEEDLLFLTVWWEDMTILNEQVEQKERKASASFRSVLVTAPPPTPNGDLHLGHLSGPYLGADIYTRYLKMRGVGAYYLSGTDDFQSYVVLKGKQIGLTPHEVATKFSEAIAETLKAAQIEMDLFVCPQSSPHHVKLIQEFFGALYRNGKLLAKEVPSLYCATCDMYLFEAHVRGTCPHCGSGSSGNLCEDCGRPNDCVDLIEPVCNYCGNRPLTRQSRRLYFPLSQYQQQLENYLKSVRMNARLKVLCDQMLATPLPDIALSHSAEWGIPVPFAGFEGQKIYIWPEMLFEYLGATRELNEALRALENSRQLWPSSDRKIVQFLGFDNGYLYAILFPGLLLAYDPAIRLPEIFICNEFYRLDQSKFSTSRMRAIWGRDLIGQVSADIVRFYLSYDRPETEQTNFTMVAFKEVVQRELIDSWEYWLQQLGVKLLSEYGGIVPEAGEWTDDHCHFYQKLKHLNEEATYAYEAETFSPQQVTRLLCELVRTARRFGKAEDHLSQVATRRDERRTGIALELAAARALALLATPIMPDFASRLWKNLGYKTSLFTRRWEEIPGFVQSGQKTHNLAGPYFPHEAKRFLKEETVATDVKRQNNEIMKQRA